jgi:thioredoxin 1
MSDLIAPRCAKGGENNATTQARAWFRIDAQPRIIGRDYHVGKAIDVTDTSFGAEVLRSELPVLLDFWAPWCGPCKAIAPIVEELAEEYAGQLKVMKLDVDGNPNTPVAYGVQSIPTLLLFKDGELVEQIKGAVPKPRIVDALKRVVPLAS